MNHILESASEMPYKIYITVGFLTGTLSSAIAGHLSDIVLTFLLGVSSAFGAALGKFILNYIKKHFFRGKSVPSKPETDEDIS